MTLTESTSQHVTAELDKLARELETGKEAPAYVAGKMRTIATIIRSAS